MKYYKWVEEIKSAEFEHDSLKIEVILFQSEKSKLEGSKPIVSEYLVRGFNKDGTICFVRSFKSLRYAESLYNKITASRV